jgi:hypothetical protein
MCIFLLLSVNHSQIEVGFSIGTGTELQGLFEALDRLFKLDVNGDRLQKLFVIVDLLKFAFAQGVVEFYFAFVITDGDGLLEVSFGPFIVFELELT